MTPSTNNSSRAFSVLEAKQVNAGKITVIGMIISRSVSYKTISKSEWECQNLKCANHGSIKFDPPRELPLKKLDNTDGCQIKCDKCQSNAYDVKNEYHGTVLIQIADTDKADNYNSLDVILYDDASRNIVAGEIVTIAGDIHIQRKGTSMSGRKLVSVLHSSSIIYKNREELKLSNRDIEIIYKHKKIIEKSSR
jgi:DNA replicative helicase MCM subunit Mcm2 (Cdc46/Mcm family)